MAVTIRVSAPGTAMAVDVAPLSDLKVACTPVAGILLPPIAIETTLRVTLPEYAPTGATAMVSTAGALSTAASTVVIAGVKVKLPVCTVACIVVIAVFPPASVPITLTRYVPTTAYGLTEIFTVLGNPPITAGPPNVAVTPVARSPNSSVTFPESVTLPDSLPAVIVVIAAVALPPGAIAKLAGFAASVNPAVTNRSIVVVAVFPALSVPVIVML